MSSPFRDSQVIPDPPFPLSVTGGHRYQCLGACATCAASTACSRTEHSRRRHDAASACIREGAKRRDDAAAAAAAVACASGARTSWHGGACSHLSVAVPDKQPILGPAAHESPHQNANNSPVFLVPAAVSAATAAAIGTLFHVTAKRWNVRTVVDAHRSCSLCIATLRAPLRVHARRAVSRRSPASAAPSWFVTPIPTPRPTVPPPRTDVHAGRHPLMARLQPPTSTA